MNKVSKLLKPITNLFQNILHSYNYRVMNMTYGSLSFIKEGKHINIKCPLRNKDLNVVEIGAFECRNSEEMIQLLNIKKLYLIDPYSGAGDDVDNYMNTPNWDNVEKRARRRMFKFGNKVVFIKKFSSDAVNDIPNGMDYIYIDGNHDYDFVKSDIENYYKKVRIGGILAGHDINIPDVLKAVREFTKKNNLDFIIRKDDWIIIKQEQQMGEKE